LNDISELNASDSVMYNAAQSTSEIIMPKIMNMTVFALRFNFAENRMIMNKNKNRRYNNRSPRDGKSSESAYREGENRYKSPLKKAGLR
jgi:hypothetical protein